jgi:hypothetical protein
MLPNPIRIKGFTRENRHEKIDHAVNTISRCTGWVTNHSMYANKVIVINFEIEARGVRELILSLNQHSLILFEESRSIIDQFPEEVLLENGEEELKGSLNITFVNEEPDQRHHVPPIPG